LGSDAPRKRRMCRGRRWRMRRRRLKGTKGEQRNRRRKNSISMRGGERRLE
jgi:hypothetical protein